MKKKDGLYYIQGRQGDITTTSKFVIKPEAIMNHPRFTKTNKGQKEMYKSAKKQMSQKKLDPELIETAQLERRPQKDFRIIKNKSIRKLGSQEVPKATNDTTKFQTQSILKKTEQPAHEDPKESTNNTKLCSGFVVDKFQLNDDKDQDVFEIPRMTKTGFFTGNLLKLGKIESLSTSFKSTPKKTNYQEFTSPTRNPFVTPMILSKSISMQPRNKKRILFRKLRSSPVVVGSPVRSVLKSVLKPTKKVSIEDL